MQNYKGTYQNVISTTLLQGYADINRSRPLHDLT